MSTPSPAPSSPGAAPAPRLDLVDVLHGVPVPDPYRWLEDADDERTRAWSAWQDEAWEAFAATLPGRERLERRVRELMATGSVGTPVHRGERVFRTRRDPAAEHAVLQVQDPGAAPRTLVDPVALDPSGTTTLDGWRPSVEGDLVAYQLSEGGSEESVLRVLDVASGDVVDGPVDRARYSPIAWLPAGAGGERSFYYVRRLPPEAVPADERQYHRRVYLHRLGTDPAEDVEVFGEGMSRTNYYGVWTSRDGRWLVVSASDGTAPRNDVWLADLSASDPAAPAFRTVVAGRDASTSAWVGRDGRLYVFTDLDAPRGRLAVADPSAPEVEHWRDLVPQAEALLDDVAVLDGPELPRPLLVVGWTEHAVSSVTVHDLATGARLEGARGRVELPGTGSIGGLVARPEPGHELWFGYTDATTPAHVWRFDARTHELSLESAPPGAVRVPPVLSRLLEYPSPDGTTVRLQLTVRADLLDADGVPSAPVPTILYGYGGFGISLSPHYAPDALAWVEAGGAYAVANLRGGGEEGEDWHRAGMREHKQDVFDDFHAAARFLVREGFTTPAQLCVHGGSNGGLLVGAAATQEPSLFAGVVCSAPLLDMVRYEQHGLGATWSEEYGSAADPVEFGWLHAYSPYHRVVEGTAYPAVLFTVFDGDSRVDPLHARKLCAALQHATSSDPATRPVLLRREGDVGHGARSVSRSAGLVRDTLAFAARVTGLDLT
ncbi:prolyl oligopeptidase family serine peptidase [Kineococcus radiotolerans]|uniref:prolyl oligopeptidase n=1 Tax=Kineococcus radiotolerans (strain ATCC BAA-149 / DSM 14245 / SRS30216) TaxID=266940 RepID=A6WDV4_KINRD|nr:prolyl oligopeptidase family serine peptidase [Kineococcus radiotolerans]ABS04993.1 Prolyl oligopeptidase [Kineococcus radiotolerans SRS30216 = ATCC BAA-149]